MIEVVDEENGPKLLSLEGAGQLHQQVHAGVPHPVKIVIKLSILHISLTQTVMKLKHNHESLIITRNKNNTHDNSNKSTF